MAVVVRRALGALRWVLVGAVAIALIGGGVALASIGTEGHAGTTAAPARTDHSWTPAANPSITKEQATGKALEAVPGATVQSAELDTDRGTTVWQVDVIGTDRVEYEVKVDADSGAVLSTDRDDD
ncbi:PepSY domain-containing protein [Nocardia wallacei]|uniref:PepSY domain-containing protein n=1 Tax=Nocardia wallacei TaxID=480035 RepID=UPI002455C7F8|nr:PepSY domain-containing protein [Nocardia wallacei]